MNTLKIYNYKYCRWTASSITIHLSKKIFIFVWQRHIVDILILRTAGKENVTTKRYVEYQIKASLSPKPFIVPLWPAPLCLTCQIFFIKAMHVKYNMIFIHLIIKQKLWSPARVLFYICTTSIMLINYSNR